MENFLSIAVILGRSLFNIISSAKAVDGNELERLVGRLTLSGEDSSSLL